MSTKHQKKERFFDPNCLKDSKNKILLCFTFCVIKGKKRVHRWQFFNQVYLTLTKERHCCSSRRRVINRVKTTFLIYFLVY